MGPAQRKVYVVGVGMTKFLKPRDAVDYPDMAKEAGQKALADAQIPYSLVEQACVGYVYGDSTCGQRAIYHSLGLTGIPIMNVNNNCSTGSTALFMARQLVQGGLADCVLALGFEKMERGSLKSMVRTQLEHFAKIAWKNHKHSTNNPFSQFQEEYSLDQVKNSRKVFNYLTVLQCCPTSDGAAAAILVSEDFVKKHGLQHQAVEIVAQEMVTDTSSTFNEESCIKAVSLAQCAELCWQLRGQAGKRQVPGAQLALQHNIGLGGAVVVTLYKMGFPDATASSSRIQLNPTSAEDGFKAQYVFKEIEKKLEEV
ncbi:hypothetical protein GDO78_013673, partial [Eleutherodactylus coqui]